MIKIFLFLEMHLLFLLSSKLRIYWHFDRIA